MLYQIVGWTKHYENHRSRELKRLDWAPIPNKMDGDGYTELVDHPDGAAHLGAWLAIVLIASKCEPRGLLIRSSGQPHDVNSLSRISRLPTKILAAALSRLCTIGWIEEVSSIDCNNTAQSRADLAESRASVAKNRAEGKGREQNGRESAAEFVSVAKAPPIENPPEKQKPQSSQYPIQDLTEVSRTLMQFPGTENLPGEPDDVILTKCLALADGDVDRLGSAIRGMYLARKKPATSWAWFPVVVGQYLERRRA